MGDYILITGDVFDARLAREHAAWSRRLSSGPVLTIGVVQALAQELKEQAVVFTPPEAAYPVSNITSAFHLPLKSPPLKQLGEPFYAPVANQRRKRN